MSEEKQRSHTLVDRLRGKALSELRELGAQLSAQVGKVSTVNEISSPSATPKIAQEQYAAVRERHIAEKQPQQQIGTPAGGKDKGLAEAAKGLREAGVTGGRAANDVAPAKQTPAVDHKQSRGRGR